MKTTFVTLMICLLSGQIVFAQGIEPLDSDLNGKREVSSLNHLLWIATTPEALDYEYEQIDNIDALATQYWDDNDDKNDGNSYNDANDLTNEGNNEGWSPIGDNINPFTGSYDGQGHVITGLTINRAANFQGLFGHTDNATIENLGLENGSVSGGNSSYIGSLAGIVSNTSVSNCYNTGDVNGGIEVGGLIGRVYISTVINCHTSGNVNGSREAGGLVGQNSENSLITNSYATGQVYASEYRSGGLVGSNVDATVDGCHASGIVNGFEHVGGLAGENNMGMISNSTAIGSISGSQYVGGLAGSLWNADINKSYATGDITVSNNRAGGLIGDIYGTSTVSNSYSLGNLTRTSGNDTIVGAFIGYTHPNSTISHCYTIGSVYYDNDDAPTENGFTGLDQGAEFISNFWDSQVSNQNTAVGGHGKTTQDMKIQQLYSSGGWDFVGETTNGVDDIWDIASNGQASYPFLNATAPESLPGLESVVFAGGDGSPETPYQIENLTHLKNTRYNLNASYEQIADIDASETAIWDDGNGGVAEGWAPIGGYYSRFFGTYNGQNYKISGLTINRSGTAYQGLFGYVENAIIDSLGIENCNIAGEWHVGALAGYAFNNSLISHCYSTGTVTAFQNAGGLLGNLESSELKQSFSTANLQVIRSNAGGLVGSSNTNSLVKNCYARGDINRTGIEELTHFGAFIGACSQSDVESCYATGSIFYDNSANPVDNGFIAYNFESNFTGNFWDSELSNQNTATGAAARTTANMKTQSTFTDAGWDFMLETANGTLYYWGINGEDNEGYPFLKFQGYKLHTEVIDWPVASNLNCGQSLGESILTGGTASIEGTFAFTNPDEVSVFGTFDYQVAFYPVDNENYATIYGAVSVSGEDNIYPEITSSHPDQMVEVNDNCEALLPDYTSDVVAIDNCTEELTINQTPEPGSAVNVGDDITITLEATDDAGNAVDISFNSIVSDATDPILACPEDQTLDENSGGMHLVSGTILDPVSAGDNCSIFSIKNDFNTLPSLDGAEFPVGTTAVTWTVIDGSDNESSCSFKVTVNNSTGIITNDYVNISVFPNPVNKSLTITFGESAPSEEIVIALADISGQIVLSKIVKTDFNNETRINVSDLRSGTYLLTINYNKGSYTKIIVKE